MNEEEQIIEISIQSVSKPQLMEPKFYRVLLHNDDYTTRDFVVWVLKTIFHKKEEEAVQIMMNAHQKGISTAGVYTKDVAETKIAKAQNTAKKHKVPLTFSMQPSNEKPS